MKLIKAVDLWVEGAVRELRDFLVDPEKYDEVIMEVIADFHKVAEENVNTWYTVEARAEFLQEMAKRNKYEGVISLNEAWDRALLDRVRDRVKEEMKK